MLGTHFKDFTHPDDIEADLILFQQVLEGRRDGYTIEKRYLQPFGEIVHVSIHVAAMRDRDGKVVRFMSQIEDITRHKEHERQLAERAAQLELALEAVRGGFWQMDILTGNSRRQIGWRSLSVGRRRRGSTLSATSTGST